MDKKIISNAPELVTEKWVCIEVEFESTVAVADFNDAVLDVTFTNRESGTALTMPGFWDGGKSWKVRFAPTELGIWDYITKASGQDIGIDGINGTLEAIEYTGDLDIYKHGFIQSAKSKYFMHADGTPFFYLGDTHWTMLKEEFDSAGIHADGIKTDSHFKYIVDRRAAQGFTVYQSEPIGCKYDVNDGKISAEDIDGFRIVDEYFKYIAEKGLVHANAELIFPSAESNEGFRNNVEPLTRYWVARYGAYPVMWTLGQEVDHGSNFKSPTLVDTYRRMMAEIYRCDPYHSPLSAHQLNAFMITAKGNVATAGVDFGSYKYDVNATAKTRITIPSQYGDQPGYSWWANQWRPTCDRQYNFDIPKDYWENGNDLPIVDYEARYHIFSASNFGARAQAWIGYLCGMGHGYGCADMWYYNGTYCAGEDSFDGIETISAKERDGATWADLIDAPISAELRYIRTFMESFDWWRLTPDFDYGKAFNTMEGKEGFYACANIGDELYTVYLYARTTDGTGKLVNMDKDATYTAQWFDPRMGKYTLIDSELKAVDGEYVIPDKPIADDMVLLVTKN